MGLVGFSLLAIGMTILLRQIYLASKLATKDPAITALFSGALYLLLTSLVNPTFESVYFHFFIAVALLGSLRYTAGDLRFADVSVVEAAQVGGTFRRKLEQLWRGTIGKRSRRPEPDRAQFPAHEVG